MFRPIHYLGSKLRLLDEIGDAVDDAGGGDAMVCDLFSGSGVVSSFLGLRHRVVAVDIQEYARVLASAVLMEREVRPIELSSLIAPAEEDAIGRELLDAFAPLIDHEAECVDRARDGDAGPLADLIGLGSVVGMDGSVPAPAEGKQAFAKVTDRLSQDRLRQASLVSRYYGGLYFSYRHAIDLDVLLARVAALPKALQDIGKAVVLSTASELVRTVGKQFAQPLRPRNKDGGPKPSLWRTVEKARAVDPVRVVEEQARAYLAKAPARAGGVAVRADYRDFLHDCGNEIGVVYADPPYTRDHYSRFYHVLETMCLRDHPALSRTNLNGGRAVSRGAYRKDRHQSPFCIRSQAPDAFEQLFKLVAERGANLVLSYSPQAEGDRVHPRVMRLEDVLRLARCRFRSIEVRRSDTVTHSKLNRTDLHLDTPEAAEVLVVCKQ